MIEKNLTSSLEFQNLMQKHIKQMIEFLFKNAQEFNIIVEKQFCKFSPPLPKTIAENIGDITLFALVNYSFESAKIEDNSLTFEAGFGAENFASTVKIPLLAIKFILLGEEPILTNAAPTKDILPKESDTIPAFLKNPENQALLKRKRDLKKRKK